MSHLRHFLSHFIAPHPSREVREIYLSTAILDFAVSTVLLFEPIYLYSIGFSLAAILGFYLALYVVYFFLLPLGGRICRRHGYEHTILYSSPFLILYYLALFAIPYHPVFIAVAILAIAVQKTLYWPGYHANFAEASLKDEVGREISNRAALGTIAAVMAPAVGGFVAAEFGFRTLFLIVAVLIVASNIPLFSTPERFEPRDFPYRQAFTRLFARANRRDLLAFLGFGEELILLALWPVFIMLAIQDLFSIGALISLATLLNILALLYIGRLSDNGGRRGTLRSGTVYAAATWLVRPFVSGPLGVFLSDAFYRVARSMIGIPLVAYVYDRARQNQAVDGIVFFEMALALGKIATALLCLAIVSLFAEPWKPLFWSAAALTLLYTLLAPRTAARIKP